VLGLARQTFTLRKLVSPSLHSPSCWIRWVTATRRFATAMPLLVKRTSVLDQVADNGGYFKVWLGSPGNAALRCGRG